MNAFFLLFSFSPVLSVSYSLCHVLQLSYLPTFVPTYLPTYPPSSAESNIHHYRLKDFSPFSLFSNLQTLYVSLFGFLHINFT